MAQNRDVYTSPCQPADVGTSITQATLDARLDDIERLIESIRAEARSIAPRDIGSLLPRYRTAVYCAMDAIVGAVKELMAADPFGVEAQSLRDRLQTRFRAWGATSSYYQQAVQRPHPGAEQFRSLELIFLGRPMGADLPGLILDDYLLNTVSSRSIRNRIELVAYLMRQEISRRAEAGIAPVRLLHLFGGPEIELSLLADIPETSAAIEVTCGGFDTRALRYAQHRLADRLGRRIHFLRIDPRQLAQGEATLIPPQHLIYPGYLLNAIEEAQATVLIASLYRMLEPGGALLVAGMTSGVPENERILIEWLLGWRLSYRSEEEHRRLFSRIPLPPDAIRIECEPLGASLVAIAERK